MSKRKLKAKHRTTSAINLALLIFALLVAGFGGWMYWQMQQIPPLIRKLEGAGYWVDFSGKGFLATTSDGQIESLEVFDVPNVSFLAEHELPSLQRFYASGTEIVDLQPLAGKTELTHLYLSNTSVHDLSFLAKLSKLNHLVLPQIEDLSPLRNLPLEYLHLTVTPDTDLKPLVKLNLHELSIKGATPEQLDFLRSATPKPIRSSFESSGNVRLIWVERRRK